jgi:tight adherence protein C
MIAFIGAASAFIGVFGLILYMSGSRTPFADRVVVPVFSGVARTVIELLPHSFVNRTTRQLLAAGGPMSTLSFFTIVTVTGILLPFAVLALFLLQSDGVSTAALVVTIVAGVAGALLPFLWLRRAARARKLTIWKSLPDAFDLLTVSVEAGLGLDAALRHVSDKLRGPFSDEIRQTLREVGLGRSRREALEDLADRVDVEELTTFVNSVIQAEQLGTSLGLALRAQGASIRTKRRQKAEEMSRKAPVKMVFPLVLFIMPTFFIVVLGPLVVHLLAYLSE